MRYVFRKPKSTDFTRFQGVFSSRRGIRNSNYVNNKINPIISFSNKGLKKVDRLNLINESLSESILRIEMFHQKIRK